MIGTMPYRTVAATIIFNDNAMFHKTNEPSKHTIYVFKDDEPTGKKYCFCYGEHDDSESFDSFEECLVGVGSYINTFLNQD